MKDAQLIEQLGGPAKVAQLLGFEKGGIQRVQNWLERGIPSQVKVDHPDIFIVPFLKKRNDKSTPISKVRKVIV